MKISNSSHHIKKHIFILTCSVLCKKEGMIKYFKERYSEVSVISFPTHKSKNRSIVLTCYLNGQIALQKVLFNVPQNKILKNFFFLNSLFAITTFWSLFILRRKIDLIISEGLINTFYALILRKLRLCRIVIYSSGDYFNHSKFFIRLDNYVSKRVYQIWSASEEMIEIRARNNPRLLEKNQSSISDKKMPLGITENSYVRDPISSLVFRNILVIGNVQQRLGYDLLLEAIINRKELTSFHVIIIGDGEYLAEFKRKVHLHNLDKNFLFLGFIEDDLLIDLISSTCFVGIALYDPSKLDHTQFSDPGKVKDYISRDLPVILTNSTTISGEIYSQDCGFVVNYSALELTEAILRLSDISINEQISNNVKIFKESFLWSKILDKLVSSLDF